MKRVLIVLGFVLPLTSWAQKLESYTFDFSKPSDLIPSISLPEEEYNGEEVNVTDWTFQSKDGKISVSFEGRSTDNMGGFFTTGWPQDDGSFDHYLFLSRGARFIVTGNGVDIESLVFEKTSFPGNLQLISPSGIGRLDAATFSWYSQGATGVTTLNYSCNGQNPKIRAFTVNYLSPMDVLMPIRVSTADKSEVHSIETIELVFAQPVKIGVNAKFELTGPQGFDPVQMKAAAVGNRVVLSLPEGVTIDEATVASRGDYTLTIAAQSIIGDDEDGYYNKKTVYTFKVVEAFNKFESDVIYPDMAANIEKIDTIVLGFPAEIGKFSADELKLVDHEGNNVRTVQAKWLKDAEYTAVRPFFKSDRDIYNYVQFVFSGSKTAPVKATGIYTLTIPEGFIWNNKYDATLEDEGVSAGARFNPEITLEYNVNGVVYPSDEVLHG